MNWKSPWTIAALAIGAYFLLGGKKKANGSSTTSSGTTAASAAEKGPIETAITDITHKALDLGIDVVKTGMNGMGDGQNLGRTMNGVGAYGGLGGSFFGTNW